MEFFNPIEWFKKFIAELVSEFGNMAFDLLGDFMLKPTDFTKYPRVEILYDFSFALASSLAIVFMGFALIKNMTQNAAGNESRSLTEIIMKGVMSFILAASAPWILDKILVGLNNAGVQYFLDKGLSFETFNKFVTHDIVSGSIAIALMIAVIIILLVIMSFQYIIRLGEYICLLAFSPIAAISVIGEDTELWSVWWRESISVVFTQLFQVALLWFALDSIGAAKELKDYLFSAGILFMIVKGPKWLRQFLYSSGSGRTAVGMAGGASKYAMYKFMMKR
jgi:hypothetical protein